MLTSWGRSRALSTWRVSASDAREPILPGAFVGRILRERLGVGQLWRENIIGDHCDGALPTLRRHGARRGGL